MIDRLDAVEDMAANSYRNFHARGLDYLCLFRSPELTRKVYFFDGDVRKLPEVVMPHDHRYAFTTRVLSGQVANRFYARDVRGGEVFERFDYMTPLNGGDGFIWKETVSLRCTFDRTYAAGEHYHCQASDIHTIQVHSEGSVILLDQYADDVPLDMPTAAFRKVRHAPDMNGLYDRMSHDHVRMRLQHLAEVL